MPLYSYKKAPVKLKSSREKQEHNSLLVEERRSMLNITLGEMLIGTYNDFHKLMTTSRIAAMIIPFFLVVSGVYIIYKQIWPQIFQKIQESSGYFDENNTSLVAGDYISMKPKYSNPGAKYFAKLKNSAAGQSLLFNDPVSSSYKGDFYLSIPSLEFNNLIVHSNADSSVETVYDEILKDGLAHFSGTSLPISPSDTSNIVIYGHSSSGDYYERTNDPAASFSVLSDLKYGSIITLKFDGKEYKYKFIKGKIVGANDLSILEGKRGQKLLTLFTCYPRGNNDKRFVATAKLIEE